MSTSSYELNRKLCAESRVLAGESEHARQHRSVSRAVALVATCPFAQFGACGARSKVAQRFCFDSAAAESCADSRRRKTPSHDLHQFDYGDGSQREHSDQDPCGAEIRGVEYRLRKGECNGAQLQ